MKIKILFALLTCCSVFSTTTFAQKTTPKKTTFVKFKPPVLTTSLGVLQDSVVADVAQANSILANKLVVNDVAKKGIYIIQSYQFLYRKRTVKEDEQGNVSPTTSISSQAFYDSKPLPEIWVRTIREDLKAGEELYFFDIIVKDNLGRIMYAPDLKIMTK